MFDVYAFATPHSVKVPIAHEELGLDYRAIQRVTGLVPQA